MEPYRIYRRLLGYLKPYVGWMGVVIVLSVLIVFFNALSLWFSATVVKTLFVPQEAVVKPSGSGMWQLNGWFKYWTYLLINSGSVGATLKLVCLLMAGSFFFKNLFTYLKNLVIRLLNFNIARDLRDDLYSRVLELPMTFFDRNRSGKVIALVANDVNQINESLTKTLSKVFTEPVRIVAFATLLFVISPRLTLVVLVSFPLCGILIKSIGRVVRRKSRKVYERMEGVLALLHDTVGGIKVIKTFNMVWAEQDRFKRENQRFVNSSMWAQVYSALSSPLVETLGVLVAVLLILFGGSLVFKGDGFGAEDFIRFVVLLFSMYEPLKALGEVNNKLQEGIAAAGRIFETLDSVPEPLVPVTPESVPSFKDAIDFDSVDFVYPGTERKVLDKVSFSVYKGQVVAIVGPSGAGKSTVLDLLPRFYDVAAGRICIDGKNIAQMDLAGLRSLFGVVSQETVLFNDTVYNNIAYGVCGCTLEDVKNAARQANALEFIEQMPDGFNSCVGEKGVALSGGQRQRLAIARAILKDPPVLILDEATSALDTHSERLVQEALAKLMQHRTTFVVAHRFSTVRHADLIVVLEDGSIVEQGTHGQLLELAGKYKSLHDMQFSGLS